MSRLTTEQAENGAMLDAYMNKVLKQGGLRVLTEAGELVTVDFSAAMLNAFSKRLKDLGATSTAVPGSPAGDLLAAAQLRFKGRPIPAVSDEADAATG